MTPGSVLAGLAVLLCVASSVKATQPTPLRIVAFGTSLTARPGWPDALGPALSRCLGRPVEVERVALAGSTSAWALTQVPAVAARRPALVLAEFYMNDAALDRFTGVEASGGNMAALLADLKAALPDARIYLMAMNPVGGLRGWLRPRLSAYIEAHRAAAAAAGAGYIDFGPLWAALPDEERDAAMPDGLHPRPEAASAVMVPEIVRRLAGACREDAGFERDGALKP